MKEKLKRSVIVLLVSATVATMPGCISKFIDSYETTNEAELLTENKDGIVPTSSVEEFKNNLTSGAYNEALEIFDEQIYGNAKLEAEASKAISTLLIDMNDSILNGTASESDAKVLISTVEKVYNNINCEIENYSELQENINSSLASKAAYKAGIALFDSKNYADAIAELKKVVSGDADHASAQAKIAEASNLYKLGIINAADAAIAVGDHMKAINVLKEAVEIVPDDSDLAAKLTVCEKNYISDTIARAEAAFIEYTDYEDSLAIINAALQNYPVDEKLNEKKAYYSEFAPTYVYDMKKLKGFADTLDTDKDIYGNSYEKSFWVGFRNTIWHETDVSYNLNKKYNTFTATIYCRSQKNDVQNMTVEIYADGKIIYQNLKIADNATQPFSINFDVTGISELRIVLGRSNGAIGSGIGMTDMILQKTEK